MDGYRLRSAHGDTIDQTQPLPIDTVEAQETVSVAPTLTYNGKAAAGAVSISSVALKPIIEAYGGRVGSFWGKPQNKVYEAFAQGNSKNKTSRNLRSVTETATAAAFVVYDPDKNLEEMFESLTGTVKRFIVKVTDKSGGTLYGWIMGVSVASDVYTFTVHNNRVTETQSWVGTLGDFDNTALEKVEIFYYNSSISFGTGTCFTEEVECPKEYSKSREAQLIYAETLANGQFFVDYMRGELIGVKADATASETVTYNVWASTAGGSSGPASNVNIEKFGGTAVTLGQKTSANSIPVVLPSDAAANSGSASSGDATYMSPTDFTATYASGTTLTITGLPYTPTAAQFMSVKRQDTTGVSVTYTPDVKAFAYNSSTGVLTVTGAAFTATDVFVVTAIGPTKMMDVSNDAQRNAPIRDLSDQYVSETFTLTNVPNATPDETIIVDLSGYRGWSVHVEKTGGADTFDVDYFVSNEDALSTADWLEITPTFASGSATADHIAHPDSQMLVTKGLKLKITTAGAANDADFQAFVRRWY